MRCLNECHVSMIFYLINLPRHNTCQITPPTRPIVSILATIPPPVLRPPIDLCHLPALCLTHSLSDGVKAGLKAAAGAGTIGKVESLTKEGKLVAYEAVVTNGKKHREIQVGPDGKKLAKPQ